MFLRQVAALQSTLAQSMASSAPAPEIPMLTVFLDGVAARDYRPLAQAVQTR